MTNIDTLVIVGAYATKAKGKKSSYYYTGHMKEYLCENNEQAIAHATQKLTKKYPECYIHAKQAKHSINHQKDKVMLADGTQRDIYLYSDWLFSYDEEEAKQYRQARADERKEETRRNKLLKEITEYYKTLTTEELEEFVKLHKGM